MKKNKFKDISFILFIVATILIAVISIPLVMSVSKGTAVQDFVKGYGVFGVIIVFLLQILQIVVALIPGELVEFAAGSLYGWLGGLIICLLGVIAGEFLIFKIVRVWGEDFVLKVAGNEKLEKFKFLKSEDKLKKITFILYFLPGTPKDLLAYIIPLTKISLKDFLIISTFARIFSIVSTTFAGSAFAEKDYKKLIVIYAAIILISAIGYAVYKIWEKKYGRKHQDNSK